LVCGALLLNPAGTSLLQVDIEKRILAGFSILVPMYHADTRQNHASLHDTQTELEEWESSTVNCFWNRRSEECSTENVVFLEAVQLKSSKATCLS
jgi:hypothetical protein